MEAQGIRATLINSPFVNKVDIETIGAAVRKTNGKILTLEDHQLICGMGAMIAHALVQEGISCHMKSLGIRGEFGRSAYKSDQLYRSKGMTAEGILQAATELCK